jgi:hypothetical protein
MANAAFRSTRALRYETITQTLIIRSFQGHQVHQSFVNCTMLRCAGRAGLDRGGQTLAISLATPSQLISLRNIQLFDVSKSACHLLSTLFLQQQCAHLCVFAMQIFDKGKAAQRKRDIQVCEGRHACAVPVTVMRWHDGTAQHAGSRRR